MTRDLALLYGWCFFALLGGACGFVVGWMAHERARGACRECPRRPSNHG